MAPHDGNARPSTADARVEREGDERVGEAERVIDEQRAAVGSGDLRALGRSEGGEETKKRDGSIVGDEGDELQKAVRHILQDLCRQALRHAAQDDGEAGENGKDDERQHCAA